MRISAIMIALAAASISCLAKQEMSAAEDPLDAGKLFLNPVGTMPERTESSQIPNSGFERDAVGNKPASWKSSGMVVRRGGAPEGQGFVESTSDGEPFSLSAQDVPVEAGQPLLLSFSVRSSGPAQVSITFEDAKSHWGTTEWATIPASNGKWASAAFYFRVAEGATQATILFRNLGEASPATFAIDDVQLAEVTEEAYATAYKQWRQKFPARDLSPRPEDGKNLALSIRKLENGFNPPRAFVVWAIGSSYTNMLGMGDTLRQTLFERFGSGTPIVYRKHVGSAVPWKYLRGWYRHQVLSDQPDLILIYTIGDPNDLRTLLKEIRETSTADIIVPSIHWRMRDKPKWGVSEDANDQKVEEVRKVCAEFGVEFVENRKEWQEFMKTEGMELEVRADGLLKDDVHQSDYGALVINENIARHFGKPEKFSYDPDTRERTIRATGNTESDKASIQLEGEWKKEGDALVARAEGSALTIPFEGNRLDLVGTACGAEGGVLTVEINGAPAVNAGAFLMSAVEPGKGNRRVGKRLTGDIAPHGVDLGNHVIPQDWTIRMIDDEGNYELVGSVTGADGTGTVLSDFKSTSGQIKIQADLWRSPKIDKGPDAGSFSNRKGDVFTFSVRRAVAETVSFKGKDGERFRVSLVQNLRNGPHAVKLVLSQAGPVKVESFEVFTPMLKPGDHSIQ